MKNRELSNLFESIRIGAMEVKNRIAMAPISTNLAAKDGAVSSGQISYYEARARGGVGLIIVEDTTIGPNYLTNTTSLADDRFISGWERLAEATHVHGAKIMPQLIHPAFNAPSTLNAGLQPVSASPIPSRLSREVPRELNVDEIQEIVEQFGLASLRAKKAGCDGVHIHCAHMYHLLGGFLSPYYNKRADEYGGTIEGRIRITLEVLRNIRSKTGSDFPIIIRISGDEYLPGGRTLDESITIAPLLVENGVDAIHISAGTTQNTWIAIPPTGAPQAPNAPLAAAIRAAVDVPVLCVGRITDPLAAEKILSKGQADMVVMGRALLADPEWPQKAVKGNWEDIAPCVGDSQCLISVVMGQKINCMVNPEVGCEDMGSLEPSPASKKVLVVGGGPAGLEAAWISALRGHEVILMEKGTKLGGQLLLAAFPHMKQEYVNVIKYLSGQARKSGVKVELGRDVTLETINELGPDVVIIATGGMPNIPPDLPSVKGENVITAWDVLSGRVFPGPNVVIIGGGKIGCETADYLAPLVDDLQPGENQVTIVEMADTIILDDFSPWRSVLVQRLKSKGVRIITGVDVQDLKGEELRFLKDGREEVLEEISHVVLATGTKANTTLGEALAGTSIPHFVIGDAKAPRNAIAAIAEGYQIARKI